MPQRHLEDEMSELKIGDKVKDNDPRSLHRVLTITSVGNETVMAVFAARHSRISIRRIHTDGKPRRSGFSLLRFPPPPTGAQHHE